MNFFLKSRPKRLFAAILILLVSALLLQAAISYFLEKSRAKIIDYLNTNFGYKFSLGTISFGFLKGVYTKNISIFDKDQDKPAISLNNTSIYLIPVFFNKIIVSRINIEEYLLFSRKERDGINVQVIFSDILKKTGQLPSYPIALKYNNLSINIKLSKIISIDEEYRPAKSMVLLKNTRINIKDAKKVKLKSDIALMCQLPNINPVFRLFKEKNIIQNFKCNLEGTVKNNDFSIDSLFLKMGKSEIFSMGLIKDFSERNPYLNLVFMGRPVSVSDFEFLRNNFDIDGFISTTFNCTGPLDNIIPDIKGRFEGCSLRYPASETEIFTFKNINGAFEYKNDSIKLENVSVTFNRLPLIVNLKTDLGDNPDTSFLVSLSKSFILTQKLPLEKIEAQFQGKLGNRVEGILNIKTYYIRSGQGSQMHANFDNILFEHTPAQGARLVVGTIELAKNDISSIQNLYFTNLKAMIYIDNDLFKIKDINFEGYQGIFNGELVFNLKDKPLFIMKLYGKNLDIKQLTENLRLTKKFLSGSLDTKIIFNNNSYEFLKGTCFVKNGLVNLDALSETIKLPSLKNTNFNIIHMHFAVSNQMTKIRGVRLLSPDIKLSAYWDIDRRINGVINTKIKTALLNRSPQFRKLISLTRIKSSYIDFKFLLGGVPKAIRAQWAKGDFKEGLQRLLPSWIKRSIQSNLNHMIDGLSNK